jgi:catechol 2,3-dioxygenase-like lactoylglutathione lyase family enzyme
MISVSRRAFIHAMGMQSVGVALALPAATSRLHAEALAEAGLLGQDATGTPARTDALPLKTTGIEHLGIMVPDVERSARFYGQLFNPALHREKDPPLRYYATLGVGYIAIGSLRDGAPRVDHFCTLVEDYRPQDVRASMAAAGLGAPGRVGMIGDPDGLQLQLLGTPGGLAKTTVPADRLSPGDALVRPIGLENVRLFVSDIEKAADHYRKFFGREGTRTKNPDRVWFQIAGTRLGLEKAGPGQTPRVDTFGVTVERLDTRAVGDALVKLGATLDRSGENPGQNNVLRFRDPDGIVLELKGRA